MRFSGFPRGVQYTPVPNPLLGLLLKDIEDLPELKCTLRVLWLLHQKKGHPRFVTSTELLNDRVLLGLSNPPQEAIRQGLQRAVERGTLLSLPVHRDGEEVDLYLLNTESDRLAVKKIKEGIITIPEADGRERSATASTGPKPNIFSLYEQNVGVITPLLAEELKDAEQNYPETWIEDAFKIAVERNRRSWRYIEAILNRWATEGKSDGEPGRHPQKTDRKEYLKEYLRRRGGLPQ